MKVGQGFSRIALGFIKKNVPGRFNKCKGSELGKNLKGSRDTEDSRKKCLVKKKKNREKGTG